MSRYHVNWITGDPQACVRKDCTEEHFVSPVGAARRYEQAMQQFTVPQSWTKKVRP